MPVADAPVPVAPTRRLSVPALTLVLVLVAGFFWGVIMFVLGRYSVPTTTIDPRQAAVEALAALQRVDQYIEQKDYAAARAQLRQLPATTEHLQSAVTTLRLERMAQLEAAAAEAAAKKLAAEVAAAEAKTPAAIAARLQLQLWQVTVPGLEWHTPTAEASADHENNGATKVEPTKAVATTGTAQSGENNVAAPLAVLSAEKWGDDSFIPTARVVHPHEKQRVYVLHPEKGLLRSDDAGATWRRGAAALQHLTGKQLAFTTGAEPLLVILGEQVWMFADRDPTFFEMPGQ